MPTSEPLNVPWWSDSLATPAGSLDAEARAASHGYKAACNCRRVKIPDSQVYPPGDVPAAAVAVEYSRPRRKDSPITAWTARKSVPSEDKCWHRPDSSTVCTFGPIAFGPAALLHSPASGDGRDWPWPERASPTARSVAEKRLSSVKCSLHAIRSSARANGFSATLCLPDFFSRVFPAWGMPARENEEAFPNRYEAAVQPTITLHLRSVSRRV